VSGNPGGRPKGQARFAALIRRMTRNGRAMVEFAYETMTDPKVPRKDRLAAMEFLADRMLGKASQLIDLDVQDSSALVAKQPASIGTDGLDWSRLTADELRAIVTPQAMTGVMA
jgi:hypothetical protein